MTYEEAMRNPKICEICDQPKQIIGTGGGEFIWNCIPCVKKGIAEMQAERGDMDQQEVDQKALTIIEEAHLVAVTDSETYTNAGILWKSIKDLKKKVSDHHEEIISLAHQTHKKAIAQRDKILVPLTGAGKSVKTAMETYDREQERIRQEQERRLREIARKEEEDRQLEEALEAEQNGEQEEAEAILEEPAYVPPVVVPKTTPKLKEGPVYRPIWQYEVIDFLALVKAVASGKAPILALQANNVFLGQQARSLKDTMKISGVRVFSKRV